MVVPPSNGQFTAYVDTSDTKDLSVSRAERLPLKHP